VAYLELPTVPPETDSGVYIGLLMGAIDDWLKVPSNWLPDDFEEAYTRMEQLKAWLVRVVGMSGIVGQVEMFAFTPLPAGWLACEGQSLLREEYPALLTAIGLTFGAVDNDHFNIPDMRRKFPLGAWPTFVDLADTGGEMETVLETPNLPVHAHSGVVTLGTQSPARAVVSSGGVQNVILNGTSGSSGSGTAHNNMPPYLVLIFAICTGA